MRHEAVIDGATKTIVLLSLILGFALIGSRGWAVERALIDGFEYAKSEDAQKDWIPSAGSSPVQVVPHRTANGSTALRLDCDFTALEERAYWDREVSWDLSRYGRLRLTVFAENADAIQQMTLYFGSGNGWYGRWFPLEDGWQTIDLDRTDFRAEETPAGWDRIERVRLSVWKGADAKAVVLVDDLEAFADEIVVVRGTAGLTPNTPQWRSAQRFSEQMVRLLRATGIEFGVLDDADVEAGALASAKLAIFPHNPNISEREIRAIDAFFDRGGKVIAFYKFPDALLKRIGLEGQRWMQPEYDGQFATIQLRRMKGFPARIRQNSWNAEIPTPAKDGATVLGTWVDLDGKDTGLPAITLHPNGAFFGHVLLESDAANKAQLMLVLLGTLLPESRDALASAALRHVGNLAGFADFTEVEAQIRAHFDRIPASRRKAAEAHLEKARSRIRKGETAMKKGDFPEVVLAAREAREELRAAYARSAPSKAEEFRGLWCHDATGIPGWSWDEAIRNLAENGFNAIVPNMLWGGLAYYPSEVLPVADIVAEKGDQIAQALAAARKYGVQLHIWKVNWNLMRAPADFVEKMRREGRLQADRDGNEVLWLSPSHPDNFQLELDSMLEIVRKYDVDGIHFDYIRYPNANADFSEGARRRFEEAVGVTVENWPDDVIDGDLKEQFADWRREQITRLVKAVSEGARAIRPDIVISAAVFADYPQCRETVGQDWAAWVEAGYVDMLMPMDYTDDMNRLRRLVTAQKATIAGRIPFYPGIGASAPGLTPEETIAQVLTVRELGAPGFMIFNYDRTVAEEHLPALRLGATAPSETPSDESSE